MICPKCSKKTVVTHTEHFDGIIVLRRRMCTECFYRFKTTETATAESATSITPSLGKESDARV